MDAPTVDVKCGEPDRDMEKLPGDFMTVYKRPIVAVDRYKAKGGGCAREILPALLEIVIGGKMAVHRCTVYNGVAVGRYICFGMISSVPRRYATAEGDGTS